MARYYLTFAALVAIAQAINITSPGTDATWDLSQTQSIKYTAVSTDPTTVDVYLAHQASQPTINDQLFTGISISVGSGSLDVSGLQLPTGSNYQINFVAPGKPEQILAQSQQFSVKGVAASASSTLAGYTGASSSTSGSSTSSISSSASTSSISVSGSSTLKSTASGVVSSGVISLNSTIATGTASSSGSSASSTKSSGSSSTSGLVSSASASGSAASASASGSSSTSKSGSVATGVPIMGLLAGAMAVLL